MSRAKPHRKHRGMTQAVQLWANNHLRCQLPERPQMEYRRKSTEPEDRQAFSHERQGEENAKFFGPLPEGCEHLIFEDSQSGKNFNREEFQRMYAFAQANPQPDDRPGIIRCYDAYRWGRPLQIDPETGEETADPQETIYWLKAFAKLGWHVRFAQMRYMGNPLLDTFLMANEASSGAEQLIKIHRDSRLGKKKVRRRGYWSGGPAPFPCVRVDERTGLVLTTGQSILSGGVILRCDHPELLEWCVKAFRLYDDGVMNRAEIARWLSDNRVPTRTVDDLLLSRVRKTGPAYTGRWTPQAVYRLFTRIELVGLIWAEDEHGQKYMQKACWDSIFPDEDLFWRVYNKTLNKKPYVSRSTDGFVITLQCAHCGAWYTRRASKDRYTHPHRNTALSREILERMHEHNCRTFNLDRERVENAVIDLIARERGSEHYEEEVLRWLERRNLLQGDAQRQIENARALIAKLEAEYAAACRGEMRADSEGRPTKPYRDEANRVAKQLQLAEIQKEQAEKLAKTADSTWDIIRDRLDEAKDIRRAWKEGDCEAKLRIISTWVDHVLVARVPNKKRRYFDMELIVFLHHLPAPKRVSLPAWHPQQQGFLNAYSAQHPWMLSRISITLNLVGTTSYRVAFPAIHPLVGCNANVSARNARCD